MQTIELKYLLNHLQFLKIKQFLNFITPIENQESYWVLNDYYDTKNRDLLNYKINGENNRFSIRLRKYQESIQETPSLGFMEKKERKGIYRLKKRILLQSNSPCDTMKAQQILAPRIFKQLAYTYSSSYYREAFMHIYNGETIRITLDKNLQYKTNIKNNLSLQSSKYYILELKTSKYITINLMLKKLQQFNVIETKFSKFEQGAQVTQQR